VKAVATVIPLARHVRTGLHRRRGYTTQPVERSHVPTRDRLRGTRGLRAVHTGQKFLESFEALHGLRRISANLRKTSTRKPAFCVGADARLTPGRYGATKPARIVR
jgi:transposase-like protein